MEDLFHINFPHSSFSLCRNIYIFFKPHKKKVSHLLIGTFQWARFQLRIYVIQLLIEGNIEQRSLTILSEICNGDTWDLCERIQSWIHWRFLNILADVFRIFISKIIFAKGFVRFLLSLNSKIRSPKELLWIFQTVEFCRSFWLLLKTVFDL